LAAREQLSQSFLHDGIESIINELAKDLEKLLDQASPGLPAASHEPELRFHLINSLLDAVSFQLKFLSPGNYSATIAKV